MKKIILFVTIIISLMVGANAKQLPIRTIFINSKRSITTEQATETSLLQQVKSNSGILISGVEINPEGANFTISRWADPRAIETAILVARDYNMNVNTFLCVLNVESGLQSRRLDGTFKCGDSGASCGIGQIQCPTWQSIRSHAGWNTDCALRENDLENIKTTAYGMTHSWPLHWTGYRICSEIGHSQILK